jgi:hypothetical protein
LKRSLLDKVQADRKQQREQGEAKLARAREILFG